MNEVFRLGKIYTEDKIINDAYLVVEEGKIVAISETYAGTLTINDYSKFTAIPGIIDIHSHGCMGFSATCKDIDELYGYTKAIASTGVTGVFATTQELDSLSIVSDAIYSNVVKGARILGIQAEGPFRHPKYMGASKGFDWPKPSVEYAKQMVKAAKNQLKYMSLSTDLEGIEDVMNYLLSEKVRIAAGHTDADYDEMKKGLKMGATSISHFGNAMRAIHQRNGGAIVACLLDPNVYIELICDHIHLAPEILDLFFKVKDKSHIILISDSSELAAMPKGRYYARGRERIVNSEGNIVLDDGTISGSGKDVLYDMKNLINHHGMPMEEVIKMASLNPARYFNLDESKGSIKEGKDADFIILDPNLNVLLTIVEGRINYDKEVDVNLYNKDVKNLNI